MLRPVGMTANQIRDAWTAFEVLCAHHRRVGIAQLDLVLKGEKPPAGYRYDWRTCFWLPPNLLDDPSAEKH